MTRFRKAAASLVAGTLLIVSPFQRALASETPTNTPDPKQVIACKGKADLMTSVLTQFNNDNSKSGTSPFLFGSFLLGSDAIFHEMYIRECETDPQAMGKHLDSERDQLASDVILPLVQADIEAGKGPSLDYRAFIKLKTGNCHQPSKT